ncbi:hypothetical protein AOC36_09640 [Erysipelothrix larvae]|uniref:Uncharacterized protein n=1 Tax=Erysipelothrix larvae TaxID=1514105 RepID=A0A0X8H1D7_9FIRM|nr:Cas9 inhibitor AcrIIA9 family protein [Erysipelothrix larvae]AMC94235.1 hypothetical protein AOC36_09640 [Erysipelothrix larvae]
MLKIQLDLEKETHPSIVRIAQHLLDNAMKDSSVSESLDKPNKSLEGMYKFVTSEAKKVSQNGAAMVEDETVFGWAQHYYDEDLLDFEPKKGKDTSMQKTEELVLPDEDEDVFDF